MFAFLRVRTPLTFILGASEIAQWGCIYEKSLMSLRLIPSPRGRRREPNPYSYPLTSMYILSHAHSAPTHAHSSSPANEKYILFVWSRQIRENWFSILRRVAVLHCVCQACSQIGIRC